MGLRTFERCPTPDPLSGSSLPARSMDQPIQHNSTSLPSLTEWSRMHIKSIFEAKTHEDAMRAVENTFATSVYDSISGAQRTIVEIKMSVTSVRSEAPAGLEVEWLNSIEAPADSSNRNGAFGGFYIIRGLQKSTPGEGEAVEEYVRHKAVTVRIESLPHSNDDTHLDGRRIVMLGLVAADIPVE